jgi:3-hydroxyisobutyrate dehydrogenase
MIFQSFFKNPTMTTPSRIHFIGVGKMGLPMAQHLHAAGFDVSVSDPSAAAQSVAQSRGLRVMPLDQGVLESDWLFSSLPDDDAVIAVAEQIAEHAALYAVQRTGRPALVYADTSTISVQASARAATLLEAAGVACVRCTVSGNNKMAQSANLTTMGSGPRAAWDAIAPALHCFGPQQFYLGDGEQARLMKLVVNLMIVQTSAMLSEALTLGVKGGLAWEDMWQVLAASAVGSPIVKAKGADLSRRDFTPTFTVEQMMKDLSLILAQGASSHVPLVQTATTLQWMQAAVAQGHAQEDYAVIIKTVERSAGL